MYPVLPNPYVYPSEHSTKYLTKSLNTVVCAEDMDGEADIVPDGDTDGDALFDDDGVTDGDGDSPDVVLGDGLIEDEGLLLIDKEGEIERDGLDTDSNPSSISACPHEIESFFFRMSRFFANLNAPTIPLSS